MIKKKLISFGEILWDILPTGAQPGGAPMNVAMRACSLGMDTQIISKVGTDAFGIEILDFIAKNSVRTQLVQQTDEYPTGLVNVQLDEHGVATYDIVYPSAWDKIDLHEKALEEVAQSDAFVFGTLATRDKHSKQSLLKLMEVAPYKIFDINLRPPHYSIPLMVELAKNSDMIKLNDEELQILALEMGSTQDDIEENIVYLSKELGTESICVTKGAHGAVLYINNQFYSHPGFTVKVEDTVGSGDSFLATLIYNLLMNSDFDKTIEMACAVGSMVASKKGANPPISKTEILDFIAKQ